MESAQSSDDLARARLNLLRPSVFEWFKLNFKIGILSVGSSARVVLYRDATVFKFKWLTEDEFQQILTFAQLLPGPNLVNVSSYIGFRLVGAAAAILGVIGLCLPGALLGVIVVASVNFAIPWESHLFQGFSLGSVAIFWVFIWSLLLGMRVRPGPLPKLKIILRFLVMAAVAGMSLSAVPLLQIFAIAITASLFIEFLL